MVLSSTLTLPTSKRWLKLNSRITDDDSLEHFLRPTGLSFDLIFTSESMKLYKPDPRFYRSILDITEWEPEECLFVGDSYDEDILGPGRAGMKTLLLLRKGRVLICENVRPDRILTGLDHLPTVLKNGEIQ